MFWKAKFSYPKHTIPHFGTEVESSYFHLAIHLSPPGVYAMYAGLTVMAEEIDELVVACMLYFFFIKLTFVSYIVLYLNHFKA
jgi:hypothetical protein